MGDLAGALLEGAVVVAVIALLYFRLRTVTSGSRKVYWRYIAVMVVIGIIGATLLPLAMPFLMPEHYQAYKSLPAASEPFAGMSYLQIGLLLTGGAIVVVGGNLVGIRSARRAGRSWWQALNPFRPFFQDFTDKDVACLGGVVFVGLGLAVWAVSMSQKLG